MVIPGIVEYSIALSPNPASSDFDIDFGVGIEARTTIEMFNTMGEKVHTLTDEVIKPGVYNISIPLSEISSGVYLIRIQSGPYTETKSVVISK